MIGLIPVVNNDFLLLGFYFLIIAISLWVKREPKDLVVLIFGALILTVSEAIFISTGVETFNRVSLFGLMPIWLPLLWGYGFVAIKRSVLAL